MLKPAASPIAVRVPLSGTFRNNFNPHSRTFSIAARVRCAGGFLQVWLSKIRRYIDGVPYLYMARRGFPMNASDYTSTELGFVDATAFLGSYH